MKKLVYILGGIFTVLVITIMIINFTNNTRKEIEAGFANKEDFLLVMGSSTCGSCIDYKNKTLSNYDEDEMDLDLKFIYSDKEFSSRTDFQNFLEKYSITYKYSPTTYYVKNGEIIDSVDGNIPLAELKQFINSNK